MKLIKNLITQKFIGMADNRFFQVYAVVCGIIQGVILNKSITMGSYMVIASSLLISVITFFVIKNAIATYAEYVCGNIPIYSNEHSEYVKFVVRQRIIKDYKGSIFFATLIWPVIFTYIPVSLIELMLSNLLLGKRIVIHN